MQTFKEEYGQHPIHLLAAIASFAIAGYALVVVLELPAPVSFIVWFGAAIFAHDLVAFPIYSLIGLLAGHASTRLGRDRNSHMELNHLRVPALMSLIAFAVFFPLILGLSEDLYKSKSGLSTSPYLGRWLALTAGLMLTSGVIYAIRVRLAARRDAAAAD